MWRGISRSYREPLSAWERWPNAAVSIETSGSTRAQWRKYASTGSAFFGRLFPLTLGRATNRGGDRGRIFDPYPAPHTQGYGMGVVYRHPEALLIWCDDSGSDWEVEAERVFPWWGKVRLIGPETLERFAPAWAPRATPRFLMKEANTGRLLGSIA